MSKAKTSTAKRPERTKKSHYQRAIFTLPPELLDETRRFAGAFHDGNNSGFVAAAIRSYIDHLKKARHTAKLRDSYASSAVATRQVAVTWDHVADDAWKRLDAKKS